MRVLVVPEFYRPDDPSANGTVNDAVAWIGEWLGRDERLHVYLLVPPQDNAGDDRERLLADRERVTLVEAAPALADLDRRAPFTETGYSAAQLRALERAIFDQDAYVDVVIDQLRTGRTTLSKWLLLHSDQWAATVRPFDVVANVHDMQFPFKHRYCTYRDAFQYHMEAAAAAFTDGVWFTAGVDAERFVDEVDLLADDVVDVTLAEAVVAGSPIDFDRFDQSYADEPRTLHLAGSFWAKKNADRLFDVAATLHAEHGIETVVTSVEAIPAEYRAPAWVDAYGEASRAEYEAALERGDLALIASAYETMARTPFEQAAAGQVLVAREAPWIAECLPNGYPFAGRLADLSDLATAAIDDWPAAITANRELLAHARDVRGVSACGRRTYVDLRDRVVRKTDRYGTGKRPEIVARAAYDLDERFSLPELADRTAAYTAEDRPLVDDEDYAGIDLVYTLRALGYADEGVPGTPVFSRR